VNAHAVGERPALIEVFEKQAPHDVEALRIGPLYPARSSRAINQSIHVFVAKRLAFDSMLAKRIKRILAIGLVTYWFERNGGSATVQQNHRLTTLDLPNDVFGVLAKFQHGNGSHDGLQVQL
jgi:hypothetical protein